MGSYIEYLINQGIIGKANKKSSKVSLGGKENFFRTISSVALGFKNTNKIQIFHIAKYSLKTFYKGINTRNKAVYYFYIF